MTNIEKEQVKNEFQQSLQKERAPGKYIVFVIASFTFAILGALCVVKAQSETMINIGVIIFVALLPFSALLQAAFNKITSFILIAIERIRRGK